MNDFNSAYQTATNVELARQEANRRAVATNSQIKAQNIIDDKNMQELKELRYDFKRKQDTDLLNDVNKARWDLQRGNFNTYNYFMKSNPAFASLMTTQFGMPNSFLDPSQISDWVKQAHYEALARQKGISVDELDKNAVGFIIGKNGGIEAQDTLAYNAVVPFSNEYDAQMNYTINSQNLDIQQKAATVGETVAKTQSTQATATGKEIENEKEIDKVAVIKAAIDALKRGEDTNIVAQNLSSIIAATEGKLKPVEGPKASEQVAQSKVQDYNLKQQTVQELNNAGRFFSAAQEQDNKRSTEASIGIANLNYRKFRNSLGIEGNMTAAQAADLLQSMPGIESDASLALHKHLTANENAKRLFFESVGLASLNAAGMSPGDVGFIDSYFGLLRDKTGIDFTDKPMESLAVGIAGVLGTAQLARNNSYMAKAESNKLLSLIASTGKSYVANLDALEATYTQNLRNINELTRSVEMSEVVYAPIKEATEQAIQFVRAARELYKIDSDAPNKIAATKYVKMSDGKMHLMVALPPENADQNQDFSQVPDDSPIWYTLINGKLVNSQKQVYGGN